jgi:Transposase IS66 family
MDEFTPEKVEELKIWVKTEAKGLGDAQAALLLSMLEMVTILLQSKTTHKKAVETLRQIMGILPKSERGKNSKFDVKPSSELPPDSEKAKLEKQIHNLLLRYQRIYGQKPERHKKGVKKRKERSSPMNGGEESIYNEISRDSLQEEGQNTVARPKHFSDLKGLRSSTEQHIRYDFDITIKKTIHHVETVTDPRTGYSVRASLAEVGPEGWQVTWNAMVNVVHLVVVFAMPAHRAAIYLGNNSGAFGESTLLRIIQFTAGLMAPVYKETFRQLAQSRRINGDDSSTRVLAVERKVRQEQERSPDPESKKDTPENTPSNSESQSVNALLDREMQAIEQLTGFEFLTKTGKPKKRLHVTMATGRIKPEDQFSQISFVRTHLGSFGNLMDKLLVHRQPEQKELTVQSDLSTSNKVTETQGIHIEYAGCLAHARRPFWRYRDVDPLNCYFLLRAFAVLSSIEDIIDCRGRTEEESQKWRGRYGLKIWQIIKARCEKMMTQYMPNSELHQSAQYVVNHFKELTHYLHEPWIGPTNNQVERILRSERTMLNNSKFRQSKRGRLAFDILRTIQLCCSGAQVSFLDYLKWALVHHEEVRKSPEQWTPYAYRLKNQPASPKS